MAVRYVLLWFLSVIVSIHGTVEDDPYSRENLFKILSKAHDDEQQNIHCIQANGTFPHPVSCFKFIVCIDNNPEVHYCPPNQVFTKYGVCAEDGECVLEQEITDSQQHASPPNWECSDEFAAYQLAGDCTKFMLCVDGKLIVMKCPKGRTFNKWHGCIEGVNPECEDKKHNCTLIKDSSTNPSGFRCPYPDGNFADYQDCSVYHQCIDGVSHLRACKPGRKFDHMLNKCLDAERAKCLFRCRQPNGVYPYVTDCHKYIECTNGMPNIKKCPAGAAFSRKEHKCVSSKRTNCIDKTAPKVKPQEEQYFKCPVQDGNYPDIMKCSNYWSCNGSLAISLSCPSGFLFNSETMKCDSPNNVTCPPYKSNKKVICYFDNMANSVNFNQRQQFQPEDMNPYLCTHIHYRNAILDSKSLLIKPGVPSKDIGHRFYERITDLKKLNPDLKVLLTLGGWKDSEGNKYSQLIASQHLWNNFTAFAIGHLYQYGFDGLELDWEFPVCRTPRCSKRSTNADEKYYFSLFMQNVYSTFSNAIRPLLFTLKASGDESVINAAYDVPVISNSVDYITVMAYLSPGIAQHYAEHPARLYPDPTNTSKITDAESIMNFWKRQGVLKDKLIMGIRTDGRKYLLADKNNNRINAPIKVPPYPRNMHYSLICKTILSGDWTQARDRYAGPYMFKDRTWIGYQDPKALQQKAEFVVKKNYAGIALISSISDDYSAACCAVRNPLLKAAVYALNRKGQDISTFGCPGRERRRSP